MDLIYSFDKTLLDFIVNTFKCDFLDFIMPIVTAIANGGLLYIILAVMLIIFKKTRKHGLMLALALVFGLVFGNLILKNLIARPRPFGLDCELLIKAPQDYSFPSGHTMASFEMATVMFCMNRKIGYFAIVVATIVAFSRLYLYVHYPTDVICGAILGTVFGLCAIKLYNFLEKKITGKI